eukprot:8920124-Heterocapsa_arctica.AAC.1
MAHPQRPGPAHRHPLDGGPDVLVRVSGSIDTNNLVEDHVDARLGGREARQFDREPARERLVREL